MNECYVFSTVSSDCQFEKYQILSMCHIVLHYAVNLKWGDVLNYLEHWTPSFQNDAMFLEMFAKFVLLK